MLDYAKPAGRPRWGFADYFWFILRNMIGWVLILAAGPFGLMVPGPGGLPMFLIGFALITLPGKRHLTARVLRGKAVDPHSRGYRLMVATLAILIPACLVSVAIGKWWPFQVLDLRSVKWMHTTDSVLLVLCYLISVGFLWTFGLKGVEIINLGLRMIARLRRRVRPWLRKKGFDLLPPRRRKRLKHRGNPQADDTDDGILEIHESYQNGARNLWTFSKPWLIRLARVALVVAMFTWMIWPIYKNWRDPIIGDVIRHRIQAMNWWDFAGAAAMFSLFLFTFRAMTWRRILAGLGHHLPVAPAVRIWSFSELARYIPGVIWQVLGRVYLTRPYGVSSSISSASQLLELSIFMLANIVVALVCLLVAGIRVIPPEQRRWLFIAIGFVPILLLLLHPRIFYGLLNSLLRKLKKTPITLRLPKRMLLALALWTIVGLLWQSLAVWLLTRSTLQLPLSKWYVLAGSYCLAWTMGFSVGFLSPGGIGVREFVFVTTLQFILPPSIRDQFPAGTLAAVAGFVGVLLRLWAICGELFMAGLAYFSDLPGALGRPNAPGRVPSPPSSSSPQRQVISQVR